MIFAIGIMAGCDNNPCSEGSSAADRARMLSAFELLEESDSFTSTMHLIAYENGVLISEQTTIMKYQRQNGNMVAQGHAIINETITQYIWMIDGHMYVWSVAQSSGIRLDFENVLNQNTDMGVRGLTVEYIEQLGIFELIVKNVDYNRITFSFKHSTGTATSYYEITVEESNNLLLRAKVTVHMRSSNNIIKSIGTMTYDYTPVTVVLPDNRDEFIRGG